MKKQKFLITILLPLFIGPFSIAQSGWKQYIIEKDGKQSVFIDGIQGKFYDEITDLKFSPDGKHFVYVSYSGSEANIYVVIDGIESEKYWKISQGPTFSTNGKHIVYEASIGTSEVVVIDGKESDKYMKITKGPIFSPDGEHYFFVAQKFTNNHIVWDGIEYGKYSNIMDNTPFFSPDSKHLIFVANRGLSGWFIVKDGVEIEEYDGLMLPLYSQDSQHLIYAANIKNKWKLIIDGKEGELKSNDIAFCMTFSPDCQHVAYLIGNYGAWQIAIDGKTDGIKYDGILKNTPVFSPDSKRLAYGVIIDKKYHMVVDGKIGKPYDGIGKGSPVFSANSDSIGYIAYLHDKLYLVVNERIIKELPGDFGEIWEKNPIETYFGDNEKISTLICDVPLYVRSYNGTAHVENSYEIGKQKHDKIILSPGKSIFSVYYFRNDRSITSTEQTEDKVFSFDAKPGHFYTVTYTMDRMNFFERFFANDFASYKSTVGNAYFHLTDVTEEDQFQMIINSQDTAFLLSVLNNKDESQFIRSGAVVSLFSWGEKNEAHSDTLWKRLISILGDSTESPQIRLLIILKLSELGKEAMPAVPALIKQLHIKEYVVVNNERISLVDNAIEALKNITGQDFDNDITRWAQWWNKSE
jgi:hypothetical protein